MRLRRIFWFIFAIGLGLAAGLLLGWRVLPVQVADVTPSTLRVDYRTDLVLMTAEIFQEEADPAAATQSLAEIDPGEAPLRLVQQAVLNGQELGYSRADVETLGRLFKALETYPPAQLSSQP